MLKESNIPKNWTWKSLGDICEIIGGTPAPGGAAPFKQGTIPFVRMDDLGKYHLTTNLNKTMGLLNQQYVSEKNLRIIKKGAILIPRSGSVALNHRAVLGVDACIVSHICALEITSPDVDNFYLYYVLRLIDLRKCIKKTTGLDLITFYDLRKIKVPFPSLETQHKIVAILQKVEATKKFGAQKDELTDQLLQSVFLEMFGDPEKNPKGWNTSRVEEIVTSEPINGFFAKNTKYENGNTKIIWISDFIDKIYCNVNDLKIVSAPERDIKEYIVNYGDVLFCRSSLNFEGIGKAACIPEDISPNTIFECHIIKISLDLKKIKPEFFHMQTTLPFFRKQIFRNAKTATMTTISQSGITDCRIILPPIELQNKFVHIIKNVGALQKIQKQSQQENDNLINALMQKAFTGELVA